MGAGFCRFCNEHLTKSSLIFNEIHLLSQNGIMFLYIGSSWCYNQSYYHRSGLPEITWGKIICFCFRYHTNQQQILRIFFTSHQNYIAQLKHIFRNRDKGVLNTLWKYHFVILSLLQSQPKIVRFSRAFWNYFVNHKEIIHLASRKIFPKYQ